VVVKRSNENYLSFQQIPLFLFLEILLLLPLLHKGMILFLMLLILLLLLLAPHKPLNREDKMIFLYNLEG